MLKNYLKIAWRNIYRNKGFSVMNLAGLTIGMTCTIMILLWVRDEWQWDHFHANHKNIYQLLVNRNFNGEITTDNAIPFPIADAIKNNFPEVKNAIVDDYGNNHVVAFENTIIKKRLYTVNPGYFHTFRWTFLKGSKEQSLSSPDNIVITRSMARALFGDREPIGKLVRLDNSTQMKVSAVIADPPSNTTQQLAGIIPFNYSSGFVKAAQADWVNCYTEGFVELNEGADVAALNKKISALANSKTPERKDSYFLFPMDKWRLYSEFKDGKNAGGMIQYVHLFTIIAFIILAIACVNFMNMSTAKSEKRAKEVGIRKTLGSEKWQLLIQFFSESFILSLLAFALSVGMVMLLLPSFNLLVNKQLALPFSDSAFYTGALLIIGFTTLFAGSYPALYLSSFNPVKVLKGTFLPGKAAAIPRKVLVVVQFVISIFLISATLLVYKQLQHVKNRTLGYDPNNLISIPSSPNANKNADVIRNELMNTGMIVSVTRTSSPVTDIYNFTPAPDYKGKPGNQSIIMAAMAVNADFSKTIGTKVLQGRDFENTPGDTSALMMNKAAVDMMQLKDPVGMSMHYFNKNYTVIGVTDNVVMASPYKPVMPMMMTFTSQNANFFLIRLKNKVYPHEAIAKMESIFKKYNPDYPFEYEFVDEAFNQKFVNENLISRLTNIFAGLAIFICCLGLSGLTIFTVEKRFKEIGVRKVLGASVKQLLLLISKEFLFLVLLAFFITVPLAWWLLHNWLEHFEYRTTVSPQLFVMSGAGILLLTLLVVSLNALKAAKASPVKNLRTE